MATDHDVMHRMMVEISCGLTWGHPDTRIEQTEHHRKVWTELARQMAEIQANGQILAIPNDTEVW